MKLILIKRAIYQWPGRTRRGLIGVPREDAHWWHVSLFDHIVVTDASQSGVRIRQRDKAKAKGCCCARCGCCAGCAANCRR